MTVILTGDIHHDSMGTKDQEHLSSTEAEIALEYVDIARKHDVPLTLFLTGRTVAEEPAVCENLGRRTGVELGGHNYYAYSAPILGKLPYRACRKVFGVDSPRAVQRWEIRRTKQVISEVTGEPVVSWRNHGYRHDRNTADLLQKENIIYYSDQVTPEKNGPYRSDGLVTVPINVLPDHEHLYHGYRTPEYVASMDWENAFTGKSFYPEEWLERVTDDIDRIVSSGGTATLLAHPGCMAIADDFETFEKLCAFLENYETIPMRGTGTTG